MGKPIKHIPVKLIVGLIFGRPGAFELAKSILEKKFGKIDRATPLLDFTCTAYYEEEFGKNLKRKFLSFEKLVPPEGSYRIKLYSNKLEKKISEDRNRLINIDPGYVSLEKVILFTTKNRSHRVYLEKGIYADLELQFANKTFNPLGWTYPDYRMREYIEFFNEARGEYQNQLKHIRKE